MSNHRYSSPTVWKNESNKLGLHTLPYDLLLNVASYLEAHDIHALHLTCKSLYDFSATRPIYRKLANSLLRRCRALPLKGFQRLSDLTTEQLIRAVNKATHYDRVWRARAPRPVVAEVYTNGSSRRSNYLDVTPGSELANRIQKDGHGWYKIVRAPPGEAVDWLSPITSSYTLCATKSGKVVCWDVQSDTCLAEWNPGPHWELWKCRVEFEERTVYFTMAKVLSGSYDDERVMRFVLMKLTFFDGPSGESAVCPPVFSRVTEFRTKGVVMNVFLLDPSSRLLSAFVWISTNSTIGLYVLPDWNKNEYVFIDTGIECVVSSNWSCILYQQSIVIHCEETHSAFQHFYPLSFLQAAARTIESDDATPVISHYLPPARTLSKKFIFPLLPDHERNLDSDSDSEPEPDLELDQLINEEYLSGSLLVEGISPAVDSEDNHPTSSTIPTVPSSTSLSSSTSSLSSASSANSSTSSGPAPSGSSSTESSSHPIQSSDATENPNPYPYPKWTPESAHFVRQWWPSLPNIPRVSCTVVLLAHTDPSLDRTRFVLAQHYFRVPLEPIDLEIDLTEQLEAQLHEGENGKRRETPSQQPSPTYKLPSQQPPIVNTDDINEDALMRLWYVSESFEVVRIFDELYAPEDEEAGINRPRPLVAVDFGHAVWIEYKELNEDYRSLRGDGEIDRDPKWLRFVTFPPFSEDYGRTLDESSGGKAGQVRTIEHPEDLDLARVETINIDQSQGAVILSDKDGRIFILCYE